MKKIIVRASCIIGLAMLVFGWSFSGVHAQTGHNITITWTAPTTGGAPVTYNVLRGTSSGAETQLASVPAPTLTYVDTTGVGGTKYFYEVSATNTGGTGPASSEASATFLVSAPGQVGGLAAVAN